MLDLIAAGRLDALAVSSEVVSLDDAPLAEGLRKPLVVRDPA